MSTSAMARAAVPSRGIGGHRGASAVRPENTLAAFQEAVRLGAVMVELDLRGTADGHVVAMHDASIDRTTDGTGLVAELTLAQLKRLDAGRHAGPEFAGEPIPTLEEVLDWAPDGVLLNLQIKARERIAQQVTRLLVTRGLERGAFLSCRSTARRDARTVNPAVPICSLSRKKTRRQYVEYAIQERAHLIQLHHQRGLPDAPTVRAAHAAGISVVYFDDPADPRPAEAWRAGADYVLVNDVEAALQAVPEARRR